MCEYCHCYVCPSGCPNCEEPKKVETCENCGQDIVVGDEYYEYEGKFYHEDCFFDEAVNLLLESGAVRKEACEEDIDDGSDDRYEEFRDERMF